LPTCSMRRGFNQRSYLLDEYMRGDWARFDQR